MVKRRKILVTTGTRAEYGILRPLLKKIEMSKKLDLFLIVTGTHNSKKYGMTVNEIKRDGFKISKIIKILPKSDTPYSITQSLGEGIIHFTKIFKKIKPDINLILGDRDEMLASAISAYHMNIPNAHIHGGDKSGGLDEYNRHAITKMSNIHFSATEKSKKRILKMGENPKFVFLTGSPSIDEIKNNKITTKKDIKKLYGINFHGDEILLVYHPTTTQLEKNTAQIRSILNSVVKLGHTCIIIAPNSDAGRDKIFCILKNYSKKYKFIKMFLTLPRSDYLGMLKNCGLLLGNSSSGIIEASYFKTSVVNIGIRQKNRERGNNVIDINTKSENSLYKIIQKILKSKKSKKLNYNSPFGNGGASQKIVTHLENISLGKDLIQKELSY
jgi:UDP-N-acetylglucosamine 2-epimerase (non-hydrolysing)/GDP/UDP-N,N'-diacetylbacillosamine 2-epimerase (hydrolysing)